MVGWLRARRIPIGLSLILLAFLVASGEILGSATSECQVEREPTLVALFVAKFTVASSTPGTFFKARSISTTHDAQCIP